MNTIELQLANIRQPLANCAPCCPPQIIGHSWNGDNGQEAEIALGEVDARLRIYLPTYHAAINHSAMAQQALQLLVSMARRGPVRLGAGAVGMSCASACSVCTRHAERCWQAELTKVTCTFVRQMVSGGMHVLQWQSCMIGRACYWMPWRM